MWETVNCCCPRKKQNLPKEQQICLWTQRTQFLWNVLNCDLIWFAHLLPKKSKIIDPQILYWNLALKIVYQLDIILMTHLTHFWKEFLQVSWSDIPGKLHAECCSSIPFFWCYIFCRFQFPSAKKKKKKKKKGLRAKLFNLTLKKLHWYDLHTNSSQYGTYLQWQCSTYLHTMYHQQEVLIWTRPSFIHSSVMGLIPRYWMLRGSYPLKKFVPLAQLLFIEV